MKTLTYNNSNNTTIEYKLKKITACFLNDSHNSINVSLYTGRVGPDPEHFILQ
jgi:hypothetical protein